ncbi:MAG: hypothetical protein DMG58_01625 [Acidobacteria bacterium]|nr:MAG: hypothetical protein DMG58_01625 [Acidobacteriota bacterium]
MVFIARNRLYHFVIDRFGRVFRAVAETDYANHAGHSIWADERHIYWNLNQSFVGIAFEAQTEVGRAAGNSRWAWARITWPGCATPSTHQAWASRLPCSPPVSALRRIIFRSRSNTTGPAALQLIDDPDGTPAQLLTSTNPGANAVFKLNGVDVVSCGPYVDLQRAPGIRR